MVARARAKRLAFMVVDTYTQGHPAFTDMFEIRDHLPRGYISRFSEYVNQLITLDEDKSDRESRRNDRLYIKRFLKPALGRVIRT